LFTFKILIVQRDKNLRLINRYFSLKNQALETDPRNLFFINQLTAITMRSITEWFSSSLFHKLLHCVSKKHPWCF